MAPNSDSADAIIIPIHVFVVKVRVYTGHLTRVYWQIKGEHAHWF